MTEKRYLLKVLEYEAYYIDTKQEYVDEAELRFELDGYKTMSDEQVVSLLNENEQLKSNWEYEKRQHKHWKTECLECIKEVSQLKREIVQLKGDVE